MSLTRELGRRARPSLYGCGHRPSSSSSSSIESARGRLRASRELMDACQKEVRSSYRPVVIRSMSSMTALVPTPVCLPSWMILKCPYLDLLFKVPLKYIHHLEILHIRTI